MAFSSAPIEASAPSSALDPEDLRDRFRRWLREGGPELERFRERPADLDAEVEHLLRMQRWLFEAGWSRWGWPPDVGGLGGNPLHRAVVAEEFAAAGFPPPFSFGMIETLGPGVAAHAPELARRFLPSLLAGTETWCQGFSEPEAGSDLFALRTTAVRDADGAFVITGQKVWTSFAQWADRCVLLARTGDAGSRHAGITAFLIDMDSPGLDVRPLKAMTGDDEFCELYLDGVVVPPERVIGRVDDGAAFVLFVLASERGAIGLQRQAWMRYRLAQLIDQAHDRIDPGALGRVYASLAGLRLCTRRSLMRLASGELPGPETSIDKLMISGTEQALLDLAFEVLGPELVSSDGPAAEGWRSDYLYSRAASIYGGTSEIQRDIVAGRLLALPKAAR